MKGASNLLVYYLALFFLHAKWIHQGKILPVAGWNSFRGRGAPSEDASGGQEESIAYSIWVVTRALLQEHRTNQALRKREIQAFSLTSQRELIKVYCNSDSHEKLVDREQGVSNPPARTSGQSGYLFSAFLIFILSYPIDPKFSVSEVSCSAHLELRDCKSSW